LLPLDSAALTPGWFWGRSGCRGPRGWLLARRGQLPHRGSRHSSDAELWPHRADRLRPAGMCWSQPVRRDRYPTGMEVPTAVKTAAEMRYRPRTPTYSWNQVTIGNRRGACYAIDGMGYLVPIRDGDPSYSLVLWIRGWLRLHGDLRAPSVCASSSWKSPPHERCSNLCRQTRQGLACSPALG
jgi:hypothetical protein